MRKNQGMEVPVIGIPLRRAIRAIRDAAWKQIRRGKGLGERAGKVKENGNASFFRSSSSYVPFAHWVNTVSSVVLFEPLFATLCPFFLSFRSLFMRATVLQLRFDSVPGHPRDPFLFLRSSVHRPLSTSVCIKLPLH